jgi:hypothetical protein
LHFGQISEKTISGPYHPISGPGLRTVGRGNTKQLEVAITCATRISLNTPCSKGGDCYRRGFNMGLLGGTALILDPLSNKICMFLTEITRCGRLQPPQEDFRLQTLFEI